MKIFSGSCNKEFALNICKHLNIELSKLEVSAFADGEIKIVIGETVRHHDCYIVQPTCRNNHNDTSVNDNFMELLIIIDALKRGSARTVNVIMPYYGYQRQDRKDYSRAPISASIIARCLESLNINKLIVYDLHAGQISGFFSNNCPLDNLYTEQFFIKYIRKNILKNHSINDIILVAPDEGAVKSNFRIASKLGCNNASIFKNRKNANEIDTMQLIGNVENKIVIMVDDILDTGGTACSAAKLLKEKGAIEIYFFVCHGLFSRTALSKISESNFSKIIITNTIPQDKGVLENDKIDIIDVSWLCAETIKKQLNGESLTELYDEKTFEKLSPDIKLL